jgi:hypothetical protein
MQMFATLSLDEVQQTPPFKFDHGSDLRVLLPLVFFGVAFFAFFGYEFYKDWKRKRRLNRLWEKGRIPK